MVATRALAGNVVRVGWVVIVAGTKANPFRKPGPRQAEPFRAERLGKYRAYFQAMAALRTGMALRFNLASEHVAIMAASHNGEPGHVEVVRDLLDRVGIPESALQCGAHWPYYEPAATVARRAMEEPLEIFNNC